MSHLPGKFIWFEHASNDIARARAFYEPLFNWHAEAMPMGGQTYHMIHSSANNGIGGFVTAEPGTKSRWVSYVSVADVDASFAAATRAGAKVQQPPTDYPPVGRGAAVVDPTGAPISLWNSADGDRADVKEVPDGEWCWNELWTPDVSTALAFYEKVFGYLFETLDMGPQGQYHVLKTADGVSRGGLCASAQPSAPPMWLPYVSVADCDATAAQASKLGAQAVLVPPTDIPDIGRFAIFADPLGAAVAVIKTLPMSQSD
jgi:predicted enzyme related to lactoylglutathione lyase